MVKRLVKKLLEIGMCATLVMGSAVTVNAANGARSCSHEDYNLVVVENTWEEKVGIDHEGSHMAYIWVEYYCMNCGTYYTELWAEYPEQHEDTNKDGSCDECGEEF